MDLHGFFFFTLLMDFPKISKLSRLISSYSLEATKPSAPASAALVTEIILR
jgi:hypothetical protein